VDKREAEKLYNSGKEPTVSKLLDYDAENKQLKRENAQLKKNSKDSSKPPSSDSPKDKESKPDKKNGKKRRPGGQPGHKGTYRKLIPVDEADKVIPHYPDKCDDCGKKLPQDKNANVVGDPIRKQITEIPPIKPTVTEHQYNTVECTCGCQTTASIPPEINKSSFGPRLTAIIAYLAAVLHVSRRGSREFCETLLNVPICLGSIQNLLEDTSNALESPDKELKDALPQEPVINADETKWNDRWLWIFVTSTFIYFQVAKSRASIVLVDIFGKIYNGILCVDRWGAYTKYHKGLIQFCWAHLKRDFLGILKEGEAIQSEDAIIFAKTMDKLRKRLMAIWYEYKNGKISRAELIKKVRPIKNKIKRRLKDHISSGEKCAQVFAKNLLKDFDNLFTFIYHEGVEPTNNIAERGIRPAVQWRKICFGNRSDNGAVLTSRLLTITRTCWLQKRNPLEFLVDAITAKRANQLAPSLLIV
jgi:transposase